MTLRANQRGTWQRVLEWERRDSTPGGILSCDVGFGKTYLMAMLCRDAPKCPTLIAVPKAILMQWMDVLRSVGGVAVCVVSAGVAKATVMSMVRTSHVILCTHGCLKLVDDPEIAWGRMIIDEAHVAKNAKTKTYAQLAAIASRSGARWFLTATPIHNCMAELIALASLVGFASSDATLLREHAVLTELAAESSTEAEAEAEDLPAVSVSVVRLKMDPKSREAEVYKMAEDKYNARRALEGEGSRSTVIMELQMRCRLAATHPNLYVQSLLRSRSAENIDIKLQAATESAKVAYLVNSLLERGHENAVIFCEWRDEMNLVTSALATCGIECFEYHGGMDIAERAMVFLQFEQACEEAAWQAERGTKTKRTPVVLVMQLRCSACGIDGLQGHVTRVYFMRPYWNPALEKQAIGRVHRQGQARSVTVTKLVLDDTIDVTCLDRQSSKLDCIEEALLNTKMRSLIMGTSTLSPSPDHGSAAGEADEVGADAKARAAAHRGSDGGGKEVQDGKGRGGDHADQEDVLGLHDPLGDKVGGDGDDGSL
jgi:non-specific serine/threonine protein kinase